MALGLFVVVGIVACWLILGVARWLHVRPSSPEINRYTLWAAVGFGSALGGGLFPTLWLITSNLVSWLRTGTTVFKVEGHLAPGVDEDDLLLALLVGTLILIIEAWDTYKKCLSTDHPER